MFKRLKTFPWLGHETCFLWGPRQVGKITWLENSFPGARSYNLLLSDDYDRLQKRKSMRSKSWSLWHRTPAHAKWALFTSSPGPISSSASGTDKSSLR